MESIEALFKYNGFMFLHIKAQAHLAKSDAILAALIEKYGDCTIEPHTDYYRELVDSIISQQLSVKAAKTIINRFLDLFGGVMPSPQQLILMDSEKLRGVGCSYAKIAYIKDLAAHIDDGSLDLNHIATLPNDEVISQLVSVKGIGVWTAHMFMIFSLGRTNILPTGDLGIRNSMANIYKLSDTRPATLLQISLQNRWEPYQSIASWYLWKSLDNSPR